MRYGRIIESGHTKTIFETASHPYTLALMNSRPKLLQNPDRLTTIDPDNNYKGLDENDTKAIIPDPKAGNPNQASRLSIKASSGHENKVLFEVKNLSKTYSNNGFFSKKNYLMSFMLALLLPDETFGAKFGAKSIAFVGFEKLALRQQQCRAKLFLCVMQFSLI